MFPISGCFFNDSEKDQSELIYTVAPQEGECTIDAKKLAKILTEDVSKELSCVEYQLDQFSKFVELENQGHINRFELAKFIRKFFKDDDPEKLIQSLDLLFDFSHLVFEDRKDSISLKNIAPLAQVFQIFNKEAVNINKIINGPQNYKIPPEREDLPKICQYLHDPSKSNNDCHDIYLEKRKLYKNSTERFQERILTIIKGKKNNNDEIDIISFAKKINEAFNEDDSDDLIDLNLLEGFLYTKRIFFGGDKTKLTTTEITDFLYKVTYFSSTFFDINYGEKDVFNTLKNERVHTFLNLITELPSIIYNRFAQDETIFTVDEIIQSLNNLFSYIKDNRSPDDTSDRTFDDVNFNNFKNVFEMVKEKIFTGHKNNFIPHDLAYIIEEVRELYEGIYFNSISYDHFEEKMNSPYSIKEIEYPIQSPPVEYSFINNTSIVNHWNMFQHLVLNFRYFGDTQRHVQSYTPNYVRTKYGLNEIFIVRWFSDRLLKSFGALEHEGVKPNGHFRANKDQLEQALLALKSFLVELNFWPEKWETFAFNMVTLSDLFQNQSNGDTLLGLEELTEYLSLVVSTVNIQMEVKDLMIDKRICDFTRIYEENDGSKDPVIVDYAIDPTCYRKKFFKTFLERANYKNKFTQLNKFYLSQSQDKLEQFHYYIEKFARDYITDPDGTPLKMIARDRSLVIGALLNIETVYLRFDKNSDNILDPIELGKAFLIFRDILIKLGNLTNGNEKYAKTIFYYMIKFKREPTKAKAYYYYKRGWYFRRKVYAGRTNIAAILAYFKKKSEEQAGVDRRDDPNDPTPEPEEDIWDNLFD